ncbi:hypothetical protein [Methylobacterium sp. 37f]|uniref:hypothetical protein n=1 Tax=Methylobacterium sp. 37f TaxID=2817058 RepID=UPI001FFDB209|nr:hypothetical protein [Methylobacterium sp. 37f]
MNAPRNRPDAPARPSLRDFDASTDRNGQDFGQDEARDVGRPDRLQHALDSDPSWQAETARVASGFPRQDSIGGGDIASVEATEAETPAANLRRISDPSPASDASPDSKASPASKASLPSKASPASNSSPDSAPRPAASGSKETL